MPAAARSQPGLRLGALLDYDIYRANADGSNARRLTDHARLRRRGDGLRQGRLDRLHVDARRRHRAVPDGRRRQEREAPDPRPATTAARSSTPTARRSCGARRGRSRARSSTTTSACSRRTWCARPSSSSTSRTPTAPRRTRSRTCRARRSRRSGIPGGKRIIFASNYGDPQGREFDLWAIDIDGTHLERITYAPGFDGFPMFSPDGKRWRSRRTARRRPGSTTPTCSSPLEPEPIAAPADERPPTAILDDIRWLADPAPRGPRHRHDRARGGRRVHRGALQGARPAARGRRRRLPPSRSRSRTGLTSSRRPRLRIDKTPRRARRVPAGRILGHGQGVRARSCSPAMGSSTRISSIDDYAGIDAQRQDRRRAPLRARTPGAVDARTPAPRRRPAPQGLDRARARRARPPGRRPAGAPEGGARGLEAARRSRRCRRSGPRATATQGFRC